MRGRRVIVAVAAAAVVLAMGVDIHPTEQAKAGQSSSPTSCSGRAFPWGGQGRCWGRLDGAEFAGWLNRHGSSARRFATNYPQLAAVFKRPWPPSVFWKTCTNGYACAVAVLPHYFGAGWRYALSIVRCETGGTFSQYVVGSAGEVSWWQFHPIHFGWLDEARAVADPRYATSIAYRMSRGGSDWSPWTCARYV